MVIVKLSKIPIIANLVKAKDANPTGLKHLECYDSRVAEEVLQL